MVLLKIQISILFLLLSCSQEQMDNTDITTAVFTDVTAVQVSGNTGEYTFSVTIASPDTGCAQYADWWEVIAEDGTLIYRRILTHSHVNEQPFTRSGGKVSITESQVVYVRAHMNNVGYGGQVMRGSVGNGFEIATLPDDFAKEAETQEPLPTGCNF